MRPLLGRRQDISSVLLAQHKLHRAERSVRPQSLTPPVGGWGTRGHPLGFVPVSSSGPTCTMCSVLAEPSRSATPEVQPTTLGGAERRPVGQPRCLCPYDRIPEDGTGLGVLVGAQQTPVQCPTGTGPDATSGGTKAPAKEAVGSHAAATQAAAQQGLRSRHRAITGHTGPCPCHPAEKGQAAPTAETGQAGAWVPGEPWHTQGWGQSGGDLLSAVRGLAQVQLR